MLGELAHAQPVDSAPGADPRGDEGQQAEQPGGQQQAGVAGVGQQQGEGRPGQQGVVGRGDVEDLPEHHRVQHQAGEGDHGCQLAEVARTVAAAHPEGQQQAAQGGAEQDGDLGAFAEQAPELVEQEQHAGGHGQRAEQGGDAHAQRQALGLAVLVDVEVAAVVVEQLAVVGGELFQLRRVEAERLLLTQALQFAAKGLDVVGPLLGLVAAECHGGSLRGTRGVGCTLAANARGNHRAAVWASASFSILVGGVGGPTAGLGL
ncbi:hypothetical protein D3C80_929050 [compost metagenome]